MMIFGSGCAIEKRFIYFPEKEIIATPEDAGMPFEDLWLSAGDGVRINAWYVPYKGSQQTLLWFHGNAGNIGNRVDLLTLLHRELKTNILIIDYRGYGKSEGEISEEGTRLDARAAYDYLIKRSDTDPRGIILFGRSLGAAVAVDLATELQFGGLILEAPFTSIKDMAKETFPWLPIGGFLKTRYDSLAKIGKVRLPLLIMHGDRDNIVPFKQGRRLFEAANDPKTFYAIPNAAHNDSYVVGGRTYFHTLDQFIQKIT
ncbi:alpha/beta hydrolase [Nitrospira defluvii]|nr:alpha/beta hydrolase [Nitrospira defluvii]